jgi:zinc transport system substrate-binding protein
MAIALALLTGCGQTAKKDKDTKPTVTVTILPQKYFVEQIAGDFCKVNVMMPPGAGEHEYEPTPKQVKELAKSDIYFFVGHLGFEKSWMNKMAQSAPHLNFVSCSKRIDLLNAACEIDHHHEEGDKEQDGTDPHIWTSPENVKTISKTICEELSAKYPEMKPTFEANLAKFVDQLNKLDNYIREELNDSIGHSFMIYHPALAYFARDYHLEQYSIEFEGKTPSTGHMKRMIDLAKKENISAIFLQAQFEMAKAEVIAKELNAEVIVIDPLAENWMDEMYSLAQKMKVALSPKTVASVE